MIPKIIHYCWFGQHELPPLAEACIESWKKYLPDYEIMRWDETNAPMNAFVKHHLEQENWAFVSDYVRLHVLHQFGGVYFDTDIEVIQSFDRLLSYPGFLAYEAEQRINNAVAGSEKGHPFFKDCADYMVKRFENELPYEISPVVATTVFNSAEYDVVIFEASYFYPYNPYDLKNKVKILMYDMIKEDTFAIHHWAKSWSHSGDVVTSVGGPASKPRVGLCIYVQKICTLPGKIIKRLLR